MTAARDPGARDASGVELAPLPDSAERESIRTDLDSTLFVVAGAGTGKTSALVSRIVALLATGRCEVGQIAAITFTEAAAAELRERVGAELEVKAGGGGATWAVPALDGLRAAPMTTLHGFAHRILMEHPVQAGLPPGFQVLDPAEAAREEQDAFREYLSSLSDDPANAGLASRMVAFGISHASLRSLANELEARATDWRPDGACTAGSVGRTCADRSEVLVPLDEALALAGACVEADDTMVAHLGQLAQSRRRMADASTEASFLRLLDTAPRFAADHKGRKAAWPQETLETVRQALRSSESARGEILRKAKAETVLALGALTTRFLRDRATRRRQQGRVTFDDLLVLARRLVSNNEAARRSLRRRYRYVLIDEFQDTDPLQLEIAEALATEPGRESADPGRLFFVGDPNQSIYRFRGADRTTFDAARLAENTETVALVANFRTVGPVLEWVNEVFSGLLARTGGGTGGTYHRLQPARTAKPADHLVELLGGPCDFPASELRRLESRHSAAVIRSMLQEGWPVEDGEGSWRPVRPADIGVLIPTRTGLAELVDALGSAGIPARFRAGNGLGSEEVRELLALLRAIDDPGDPVAVVAAVRCSAFGCTDSELAEHVRRGGRWDPLGTVPDGLPPGHSVAVAMTTLSRWHRERLETGVAALVSRVCAEIDLFGLACQQDSAPQVWQRLRVLEEHARMVEESGGHLRQFLESVDRLIGSRTGRGGAEDQPGDEAVGIFTMHGAKGLEFPVAVLCGFASPGSNRLPVVLEDGSGGAEIRLRDGLETPGYRALAERERVLETEESLRLAYVAATRARDHLVVSCWHARDRPSLARTLWEASQCAEGLWTHRDGSEVEALPPDGEPDRSATTPPTPSRAGDASGGASLDLAALTSATAPGTTAPGTTAPYPRPRSVAATSLRHLAGAGEPGGGLWTPQGEAALGEPLAGGEKRPGRRSRPGHASEVVGTAVHAVLERIDLATPAHDAEVSRFSRAVCASHGAQEFEREVSRLVSAALSSAVVRLASTCRHWKEMPVATEVDGVLVEGFVDLLFEEREGGPLVVVDYKTDDVSRLDRTSLVAHSERYGLQAGAYALAVERASGREVEDCVLLYLGGTGATEMRMGRPTEAMGQVAALLADGSDRDLH